MEMIRAVVTRLVEETERRRIQKIKEDMGKKSTEFVRLVEDNTKPRLFFHVLDEQQRKNVWYIGSKFLSQGLYVTNVLINKGKVPDETQVRYFRVEDEKEAQQIDAFLGTLGILNHRTSLVDD